MPPSGHLDPAILAHYPRPEKRFYRRGQKYGRIGITIGHRRPCFADCRSSGASYPGDGASSLPSGKAGRRFRNHRIPRRHLSGRRSRAKQFRGDRPGCRCRSQGNRPGTRGPRRMVKRRHGSPRCPHTRVCGKWTRDRRTRYGRASKRRHRLRAGREVPQGIHPRQPEERPLKRAVRRKGKRQRPKPVPRDSSERTQCRKSGGGDEGRKQGKQAGRNQGERYAAQGARYWFDK